MIRMKNFEGIESVVIAATTSSQNITFSNPQPYATDLRVANSTGSTCFVAWGVGTQIASSPIHPVLAGEDVVFNKGTATDVAVILLSGTGNVYLEQGYGS